MRRLLQHPRMRGGDERGAALPADAAALAGAREFRFPACNCIPVMTK